MHTTEPFAVLLTPGAGAGRDNHTLVAVERGIAPVPCRRIDFDYRIARRRVPDRPPVAIARIRSQAQELLAESGARRLVLGGRSFGGRMCSMAVAEGLPAAGLILLSYPLHPPGKPDRLRVDHFPGISCPVLMINGDKDPFGSPAEFADQLPAIPGPVTTHWLPGGHDPKTADKVIPELITQWLAGL